MPDEDKEALDALRLLSSGYGTHSPNYADVSGALESLDGDNATSSAKPRAAGESGELGSQRKFVSLGMTLPMTATPVEAMAVNEGGGLITPHKSGQAKAGISLSADGLPSGEDGIWAADTALDLETAAVIRQWGLVISQMTSLGGSAGMFSNSVGTNTYDGDQPTSFPQQPGLPGGCVFDVNDHGGVVASPNASSQWDLSALSGVFGMGGGLNGFNGLHGLNFSQLASLANMQSLLGLAAAHQHSAVQASASSSSECEKDQHEDDILVRATKENVNTSTGEGVECVFEGKGTAEEREVVAALVGCAGT